MAGHYYISYSSADAREFALHLADALSAGPPSFKVWIDQRELRPGEDWDGQIMEAIRDCASVLFVMTRDSVRSNSVCKQEWTYALRYKKPVVPLLFERDAEMPFRLEPRQYIDFTGDWDAAVAQLRRYLHWLTSDEGILSTLKERLFDAERDLARASEADKPRIAAEITQLRQQIAEQGHIVANPQAAAQRTQESIARGIERERQPAQPVSGEKRSTFITPPPAVAPTYFQDRYEETKRIGAFLRDDAKRLLHVVGRGGIGKTALVCRVLKSLERGVLPDDGGELSVDGIVYLSDYGVRRINLPNLYADLSKLLPDDIANERDATYKNPQLSIAAKMQALLQDFPAGRYVVLLDSLDALLDPNTHGITDAELDEALRTLLTTKHHAIKVIITSQIPPRDVLLIEFARQARIDLDMGLPRDESVQMLRALDADGTLGLRDAPDDLLAQASERTQGNPRALEALVAILSADRDTSLGEMLANTTQPLPEYVVRVLVGEAFSRLDPLAQQVMQALAVYGRPVTPTAIDYLLQAYAPSINSAPMLNRLVNMQFARKESGRYYLHPVDRDYALRRVPPGTQADRNMGDTAPFTRFALLSRGADYFQQTRTPREAWKTLDDLAPQLAEFELRYAGEDYEVAATIVLNIENHLRSLNAHAWLLDLYERLQGRVHTARLQEDTRTHLNRVRNLIKRSGFDLRQTLRGHTGPISRLAWFPDGTRLASASLDGTVRIWNVRDGSLWKTLSRHQGQVLALVVTPDGRRLISASADTTLKVWDLRTGAAIQTLRGHTNFVTGVAVLPDGRGMSASWDRTLKVWNLETGKEEYTLRGHSDRINALTITPDGQRAISAAWDQTVRVWNLATRHEEYTLAGRTRGDNDVVVLQDGKLVASAAEDATIRLWDLSTGQQVRVLEGPTAYVTGVSGSADGSLLAAKSADGHVWIWRCDTWGQVDTLSESSPRESLFAGLAFAPQHQMLATLGEEDTIIRIWNFDLEIVLSTSLDEDVIPYTTTKIVLVGESGVGKSSLGWRLKYGAFKEQSSSHGQQFWVIDALQTVLPDRTVCDVVLWDFAGQPDYRLIHTLFLDDVDVGLLLFDPTERQEQPKLVEYWLKQLLKSGDRPVRTILVGARIDRGTSRWMPEELVAFCHYYRISGGYVGTSALTGEGVPELLTRIKEQVTWDKKPPTVSPTVFSLIKDVVLALRSGNVSAMQQDAQTVPVLLSPQDVSTYLARVVHDPIPSFTYDQMMAAVGHLAKHGYVSVLQRSSGDQVILLLPDLLNNLAASIVLEARRTNFGTIEENKLLRGGYPCAELAGLGREDQEILLDAAAMLFLKRNLCFRKIIKNTTFLVFPSLINQKRPLVQSIETMDDASYIVSGSVENVYPTLVVQLGNTNEFDRTYTWQNQAQYEMGHHEVCGFRQIETGEGEIELVLYYSPQTQSYTRMIFQGYFEKFLSEHQVTISKYVPVLCSNPICGKLQERSVIVQKIRDGITFHYCGYCGTKINVRARTDAVPLHAVQQVHVSQDLSHIRRAIFEAALVRLKRLAQDRSQDRITPQCFISYAWGVRKHERWVIQLATDLRKAEIGVVLDQWDNAEPGSSISRFIEGMTGCEFIAVVGTPEYKRKYENKGSAGHVVAAECDLISTRLIGTEVEKKSIMPLLLAGDVETSLPPLLYSRTYVDFRQDDQYFLQLLDMIIKMFGLPFRDPAIIDFRESVATDMIKTGTMATSPS